MSWVIRRMSDYTAAIDVITSEHHFLLFIDENGLGIYLEKYGLLQPYAIDDANLIELPEPRI